MDRRASWIATAVGGRLLGDDVTVGGPVVTDSREASPGSLYVARRGERADGHSFVASAAGRGAVCALVEHEVPGAGLAQIVVPGSTAALGALAHAHLEDLRREGPLDVIAITGSAGKTTTKDLLAQVLTRRAATVWPRMSFNNEVGVPLTVLGADAATRHLVLEMGASAAGDLASLTRIAAPDVAVELMVGTAHLGGFGSREGIMAAKAELVEGLRPGGTAVLNADDDMVMRMVPLAPGPVVRFSACQGVAAEIRARAIDVDEDDRASFTLEAPDGTARVRLRLVGRHHVRNALAAAGACHVLGIGVEEAAAGLSAAGPLSPHRMAVSDLVLDGRRVTLVDDSYNANPDSMRAGLEALRSLSRGRRMVAVLGEMLELGPDADRLHREAGLRAAELGIGVVVALGPGAGALAGPELGGRRTAHVDTPEAAIDLVGGILEDGDVVLVKGSNGSGAWRVADALVQAGGAR
jgi:UDP-N-acetylmuramoyl-tripeptide--D-alanyl-D-alanine ligase